MTGTPWRPGDRIINCPPCSPRTTQAILIRGTRRWTCDNDHATGDTYGDDSITHIWFAGEATLIDTAHGNDEITLCARAGEINDHLAHPREAGHEHPHESETRWDEYRFDRRCPEVRAYAAALVETIRILLDTIRINVPATTSEHFLAASRKQVWEWTTASGTRTLILAPDTATGGWRISLIIPGHTPIDLPASTGNITALLHLATTT